MKNLIPKLRTMFFSIILIILCSNSCFESDPPKSCDWEQELNSYLSSVNALANNPTPSNCESLKTTALRLIDKFGACDDFAPYVADLRSQWTSIDCSDF